MKQVKPAIHSKHSPSLLHPDDVGQHGKGIPQNDIDRIRKTAMKTSFISAFALIVISASMPGIADTTVFNPATDFSIENGNPNGFWTYGWLPSKSSGFVLFTTPSPAENPLPGWSAKACPDGNPSIWRNLGKEPKLGVGVGQLALHPGCKYEPSILRWTSPGDGQYQINGEFFAGDKGVMRLGVRQGGKWLWKAFDAGKFSLLRTVSAGTSVDFIVYGGYDSGSTPLELVITPAE